MRDRGEISWQLRVGVHCGEVTIEEDGDLLGDAVNVSARLEGKADVGGVAVSKKVVDILAAEKERSLSMWRDQKRKKNKNRELEDETLTMNPRHCHSTVNNGSTVDSMLGEPLLAQHAVYRGPFTLKSVPHTIHVYKISMDQTSTEHTAAC